MAIKIKQTKKKFSLNVDGDFTIYNTETLRKEIAKKFLADRDVEVDLASVEEIDVTGLQLLVAMDKECTANGNVMKVVAASDVAQEALNAICFKSNIKNDSTTEVQL